jgi:hypothetical protein
MPGIPREVIEHKLGIDPAFEPIKLLEAEFIRPVDYPSWLTNPILVEKPGKSWRTCIDYTSMNKACPKDEYPLPRIC